MFKGRLQWRICGQTDKLSSNIQPVISAFWFSTYRFSAIWLSVFWFSATRLIQFLEDKSLSHVMREAMDDGKKALEILRQHYAGSSKARIISLCTKRDQHVCIFAAEQSLGSASVGQSWPSLGVGLRRHRGARVTAAAVVWHTKAEVVERPYKDHRQSRFLTAHQHKNRPFSAFEVKNQVN